MESSKTEPWLVHIHPSDNVLILGKGVSAGENFHLQGQLFQFGTKLELGHKIALRPIRQGEKILKYGAPIGSATEDIPAGAHIHLHNLRSDYLPTYTLDENHKFAH